MLKNIIGKLERKMIITYMLTWLNWSVAIINVTPQLLDMYRYIDIDWLCYCYLHGLNQSFLGRWIHLHYHIYLHHSSIQIKMKAEIFV